MYDAGSRPSDYLREYAEEFCSLEIDATVYGTPPPERVRKWAAQVPDGFTFALKLPREITHERRLIDAGGLVEEFVASALEFGDKLEAILIQMPPDFTPAELGAVEAFVDALPAGPRWAFEVRDRDWFHGIAHQRFRDALGTHGVALAVTDGPFVPVETMLHELYRPTASHAYLRWMGVRRSLERYDRIVIDRSADIVRWAEAIHDVVPQLVRLAGYANNEYAGHSPETVRQIYGALGVPHERPARVEQPSLFG
ncbi:MAG TPA: DUF72 domain-containing protein [Candidatus Elarobacter sp.]|jgi:uncharacterized protein YecE (DUF72 family)|nr:DUF72 domain-containing protein [Candidatus Elarobacter sp.]